MELKVGMYVRTKDTGFCKIVKRLELDGLYTDKGFNIISNILKSSFNIIDLIEVGDYVNGYKVIRVDEKCNLYPKTIKAIFNSKKDMFDIFEKDIKSIVTKEQFASMEYKVEEK